jgi:hypothetical protein
MSYDNEIANQLRELNEKSYKEDLIEEAKLEKEIKESEKEIKELEKKYNQKLKDLIDSGGFSMEGITEIRAIIMLIQNCPEEVKPLQANMGKCLEILVNMSNQYLQLYKKENKKLWNDLDGETNQNKND